MQDSSSSTQLTLDRKQVLFVAWPIIISNLSTPLLGIVDTAVIGNLGNAALIGAIAVGGVVFSFLYWGFGFLRMGTTGLVAQARGAGDKQEEKATFYRALLLGTIIGLILLSLKTPLAAIAFQVLDASIEVETAAKVYFDIRIWTAPISLAHLAMVGYLLGTQQTRLVLLIQLTLNGANIVLDILFVTVFMWGVAGVAYATIISEVIAFSLAAGIIFRQLKLRGAFKVSYQNLMRAEKLHQLFTVNRDIMIRTLCLIFAFAWFTNEGAKAGDAILSANAILLQFVTFSAFFLDGFALAAESLVGHAVGKKDKHMFDKAVRFCTELGASTALLLSVLIYLFGTLIINSITNVVDVQNIANEYLVWAILAPILSFWCYLLDGIFIGATKTVEMRNAMVFSLIVYLASWYLFTTVSWVPSNNHGLWAALQVYFIARAASLAYYWPSMKNV